MMVVVDVNATQAVDHLAELVGRMMSAPTDEDKALLAVEAWEYARRTLSPALATERRAAVRGLRAQGMTLQQIGDLLGITTSRVSQIVG